MNHKGFTLVELLAVIVILAVVAIVTVPIIFNVLDDSQEGINKSQEKSIIESAKKYVIDNPFAEETHIICVNELIKGGYIDNKALIDPMTKAEFNNACVVVLFAPSDDEKMLDRYSYEFRSDCYQGVTDECKLTDG